MAVIGSGWHCGLQLSLRVANNESGERSDKVAIIGSDPGLMRMWCTAEEQS